MKKNQYKTPLFDTLYNHALRNVISFHTPGHKNGQGIVPQLREFTGKNVYSLDVTVFPEVDSLHDPVGCIKSAQKLMAEAYGVAQSFLLVNGSSVGNEIMFLSACKPGDSVILSRNCHKSVLGGIILSGVWPIWIQPTVDQELDIIFDVSPERIEKALTEYPEAKAVFVTSPTYNGLVPDLVQIAELVHRRGKVLLVDEAHGPHLKFHPDLPISAVEAGADLCVQSVHKVLSALSQGSVLHYNSELIDFNRVRNIVSLLQTTSPNYFILASLDLARRQVYEYGERIFTRLIKDSDFARTKIGQLNNLYTFTREEIRKRKYDLDPTKITVNVTRTGLSGYQISEILNREYKIQVDCADLFNLIALLGIGTTHKDITNLVSALKDIDVKFHGEQKNWSLQLPSLTTEMVISPRDAFLTHRAKRIPLSKSAGYLSAQTLTPYPPGIPVLIPGERITPEIRDYLLDLAEKDIRVSGQETDTLKTIKVVVS